MDRSAAALDKAAERLPLQSDPAAERGHRHDNRNQKKPEQQGVFYQSSAFVIGGNALDQIQRVRHWIPSRACNLWSRCGASPTPLRGAVLFEIQRALPLLWLEYPRQR